MGKVICVNCGVKISFMGKKLKKCTRCGNDPLVKVEKQGEYKKTKKKKFFKDDIIEEVKDAGNMPNDVEDNNTES